jgi:hypothetical protein
VRHVGLDLGGRQIRNALAQQDFDGAQLRHGEADFTEGALVKPIDKLTGSDFFDLDGRRIDKILARRIAAGRRRAAV